MPEESGLSGGDFESVNLINFALQTKVQYIEVVGESEDLEEPKSGYQ